MQIRHLQIRRLFCRSFQYVTSSNLSYLLKIKLKFPMNKSFLFSFTLLPALNKKSVHKSKNSRTILRISYIYTQWQTTQSFKPICHWSSRIFFFSISFPVSSNWAIDHFERSGKEKRKRKIRMCSPTMRQGQSDKTAQLGAFL